MIYYNPWRIIPITVLVIYFLTGVSYSKNIILEDENDVYLGVLENENVNIKCDYWGEFNIINFEWKKNHNNMWHTKSGKTEIISRSQWLSFLSTDYNYDFGKYSCSINGINGNETFSEKRGFILIPKNSYYDILKIKPTLFTKYLTDKVPLLVNSILHLMCPFESYGDTVFSWYKNDNLLIEKKAILEYSDIFGNEYSSKKLLGLSDAGNYTCLVRNSFGSNQHTFSVVVYEDVNQIPLYNDYPRHLSLNTGDTARFSCQNMGTYNSVEWYFSNSTNPMDIDKETIDFQQFKMMKTANRSEVNQINSVDTPRTLRKKIDRQNNQKRLFSNIINSKHVNNKTVYINQFQKDENEYFAKIEVNQLTSMLVLEDVTIDDAGWYFCVTKGESEMLMAEARLDVDKKDKINTLYSSQFFRRRENILDNL